MWGVEIHAREEERHRILLYELPSRVPMQAPKEESDWPGFMEIVAYRPMGKTWEMLKRIKCKMKEIFISGNVPPSSALERKVIEKRWWKKKKWRDKDSSGVLVSLQG